jgi:hypothetical protein
VLRSEAISGDVDGRWFCSDDVFKASTLVLFVHEFGNLVAELEGAATCNVKQEKAYLVCIFHPFMFKKNKKNSIDVIYGRSTFRKTSSSG